MRTTPSCGPKAFLLLASFLAVPSLLLIDAAAAGASSAPTTTTTTAVQYNRSCEKTATTQIALDKCAQSELRQVQGRLTTQVNELSRRLGTKAVRQVQSRWLTFRASECALEASPYKGGTIQPLIVGECELGLTVERLQELRTFEQSLPH
jgi:uncharacterized protein YecT (DUF1311 family)